MPTSPALFHTGIGVIGAILFLTLAASFLALAASSVLLWRYRRTMATLMAARAGDAEHRTAAPAAPGRDAPRLPLDRGAIQSCSFAPDHAERLYRRMIAGPWRHAGKYAAAGVLSALLLGWAGFLAFSQTQINYQRAAGHPLQFFFMCWTCVWPAVLTTTIVAAPTGREKWQHVLIYLVVLAGLGALLVSIPTEGAVHAGNVDLPAWRGESPLRLAAKWSVLNLAPTFLIVAFRTRRVRAVAPLMLGFMTVVSAGVGGIITAAFVYKEFSVAAMVWAAEALGLSVSTAFIGYFAVLCSAACLLFGVFGWLLVAWIRRGYQRKSVSDESLAIDAFWAIFASFYAVILASGGPGWALAAPAAFVVFKVAVRAGNKRLLSTGDSRDDDPALLVLRVFALGTRSEHLFEMVSRHWRHIGSVRIIAGTDLARSTVAPHQFLAFVVGRLNQFFVGSEAAIDRSLANVDNRRDADGRFRINQFFCHADTWQGVLKTLVKTSDVVMMDLRSFSRQNDGCVFEIEELLDAMPVQRLVFVVDGTTDKRFLEQTLEETCRQLRRGSPNAGVSASAVQTLELDSLGHRDLQGVLRHICAAVGAGQPRAVSRRTPSPADVTSVA